MAHIGRRKGRGMRKRKGSTEGNSCRRRNGRYSTKRGTEQGIWRQKGKERKIRKQGDTGKRCKTTTKQPLAGITSLKEQMGEPHQRKERWDKGVVKTRGNEEGSMRGTVRKRGVPTRTWTGGEEGKRGREKKGEGSWPQGRDGTWERREAARKEPWQVRTTREEDSLENRGVRRDSYRSAPM